MKQSKPILAFVKLLFVDTHWMYGIIIQTGTTCKEIPSWKSIEFGMALKYSVTHYKQKTEIFLGTRPPTCRKPNSYFWFVRKNKKRIKENLQLNL